MNGRTCRYCGSLIDPEDYCPNCQVDRDLPVNEGFRCSMHDRPRRGPTARFCGKPCRLAWWRDRRRARPALRRPKPRGMLPIPGL